MKQDKYRSIVQNFSFPDVGAAKETFGSNVASYGAIVSQILPDLFSGGFHFEDPKTFEMRDYDEPGSVEYAAQKYWQEILCRAHMCSVAAILRTTRWIDAAVREQKAGNLFGWASACRSLIESSGDISFSLYPVPLTLADQSKVIKSQMRGEKVSTFSIASELEDTLIHFTHGRRIPKGVEAPKSHYKQQSAKYVEFIEKMKIDGVAECYADLCEIIHPAAASVQVFFCSRGSTWMVDPEGEKCALNERIKANQKVMGDVLMAAYNPPLLILKVIRHFRLLSGLDFMDRYTFDGMPLWKKS